MTIQTVFPPCFVYLAGPIMDCTFGEANDWRKYVADRLKPHNIIGISPLRCEPIHGERYTPDYPDPCFGVPRAIAAKNKFDVQKCDITLAMLPKPKPNGTVSMGTLEEIAWADQAGKMVIQVTDDPKVINHPVVDAARGWKLIVDELRDAPHDGSVQPPSRHGLPYASIQAATDGAIQICIGVLGGYTGGKNV